MSVFGTTPLDIVLRNLSVPPVKGGTQPLLSTVAAQRDGTRGTNNDNEPGDPVSQPGDSGLRWVDSAYPPLTPGGSGGGTVDPLFTWDKVEYLGCFLLGDPANHNNLGDPWADHGGRICFAPPDGRNGTFGSLFMTCRDAGGVGPNITEYQIPETIGKGLEDGVYAEASLLQVFSDVMITAPNPDNRNTLTWPLVSNGRLIVHTIVAYKTATPVQTGNIFVCSDYTNIANASWTAQFLDPGDNQSDTLSAYAIRIPESRRADFNNHTYIAGGIPFLSIVSRFSRGFSVYGFTPENITDTTTNIPTTQYADFKEVHSPEWNANNSEAYEHYLEQTGLINDASLTGIHGPLLWTSISNVSSTAQSNHINNVTDEPYQFFNFGSQSPQTIAIINRKGVYYDSIVVKSADGLTTYVKDVDYTLYVRNEHGYTITSPERSYTTDQAMGNIFIQSLGTLQAGNNVLVSYNYLSSRFYDYTSYPAQQAGGVTSCINYMATCGGGVFVPNTNTLLFVGLNGSMRFGNGYKAISVPWDRTWPGHNSLDIRDSDDYFWAFNVDDIINAENPHDPRTYSHGIFNANRYDSLDWDRALNMRQYGPQLLTQITGCCYDPATKRLYVARKNFDGPTKDNTNIRSVLIDVFRLNF